MNYNQTHTVCHDYSINLLISSLVRIQLLTQFTHIGSLIDGNHGVLTSQMNDMAVILKRKDEMCPFSSLAFIQPTTLDKEPKKPDESFDSSGLNRYVHCKQIMSIGKISLLSSYELQDQIHSILREVQVLLGQHCLLYQYLAIRAYLQLL